MVCQFQQNTYINTISLFTFKICHVLAYGGTHKNENLSILKTQLLKRLLLGLFFFLQKVYYFTSICEKKCLVTITRETTFISTFRLCFIVDISFLCRLRSIAAHRDHFVRRLSFRPCVCPIVTLSW